MTAKHGDRAHQLEAYFPFDPYRLPRSKKWLVGDYIEWRGVPGLQNAPPALAEMDSSEEEVIEDDMDDEGTETPVESD